MKKNTVESSLPGIFFIFAAGLLLIVVTIKVYAQKDRGETSVTGTVSCVCCCTLDDMEEQITEAATEEPFIMKESTANEKQVEEKKKEESLELPEENTNVKLFTDYRAYNLWFTPHYRLQQAAWTDEQGLRRYNNDYIVALASFYSVKIGDRFSVTLDTGRTFTVFFGDGKWDGDSDERKMYTPCVDYNGEKAANVLEFIVDEDVLASEVYAYGSIDKLENFKGNIVKMKYLGRDDSQDWDTYYEN